MILFVNNYFAICLNYRGESKTMAFLCKLNKTDNHQEDCYHKAEHCKHRKSEWKSDKTHMSVAGFCNYYFCSVILIDNLLK